MHQKNAAQPVLNISFIGPANVGKTTIIQRLLGNDFSETTNYEPTIFEFYQYVNVKGVNYDKQLCLNISDTSGTFDFPAMDRHTVQNSDVVLLVFDLESLKSFHCAVKLASDIKLTAPNTPIIFVGNKSDLKQLTIDSQKLEDYVMCTLNHAYVEISAKCDDNVDKLLKRIYEEHEIAVGPYSVRKEKKSTVRKLKKKLTKKISKICTELQHVLLRQ